MTITDDPTTRPATAPVAPPATDALDRLVAVDLYRDIHKGIRAELFAVTSESARLDPADGVGRAAIEQHVDEVIALLVSHAEHEDAHIGPVLGRELPELEDRIEADHHLLEARLVELRSMAADLTSVAAADVTRLRAHRLHLALASFTGAYLQHQDLEEVVVMPALEAAIGVDAVLGIHQAIVGSIPPEEMARSLAIMLPAMNIDDRTEMLGGMQAGAPPEVFAGVWGLAGSVLEPADHRALAARLGLS